MARKLQFLGRWYSQPGSETLRLTDANGKEWMILISAIVRPFKLEPLRRAIVDLGVQGITVTEVHGNPGDPESLDTQRADDRATGLRPLAKIEIAVDDSIGEPVIEAICNLARTGRAGDGELWVEGLQDALRIRTGERGREAI